MKTIDLFNEVSQMYSIVAISERLCLHKGTVKRWVENNEVPDAYFFQLNSMLGNKYDIPVRLLTDIAKDQYYTKPEIAKYCYDKACEVLTDIGYVLDDYHFIEPSCGQGVFFDLLPQSKTGVDIDPKIEGDNIVTSDYLSFNANTDNNIVIGNPPFGLRGNLALQFINHSYLFADAVCFILPPLFDSNGKGSPMKRVNGYRLAHTENLPLKSFIYPNNKEVDVATVFQVWTKLYVNNIKLEQKKTCNGYIKVYSLSDNGTPSGTRNKKMLDKCDVYLPSTCFSGMRVYNSFEELPNRRGYGVVILREYDAVYDTLVNQIDWEDVAFKSTNSATNLRTELIQDALVKKGFCD